MVVIPIRHDDGRAAAASDVVRLTREGPLDLPALPPLSLYVHLPWCLQKCPYCDFNSHAVGSEPLPQARYGDALLADLDAALPLIWGRSVHSVFFGGGTPSLFAAENIDRLLSAMRARLPLVPDCEVTLEANPGTFERDRFRSYAQAGVNRLSIGVQSFSDAHLRALGRVHNRAQAWEAVSEAHAHFPRFNLDLMYALPDQSLAQLEADLDVALSFAPPHLSIYHLTIEPNTLFALQSPKLPDEDSASLMLDRIVERATEGGLQRYEVSAFAQGAAQRCRHNLNYWQFGDYLGLGAGAHSKLSFAHRIVRETRWRDPIRYMDQALAGQSRTQHEEVPVAQLPFEFMLNGLRLAEGFALKDFTQRTGLPLTCIESGLQQAQARGLIDRDLLRVWPTTRGFDFLSDLQAIFLSNAPD